MPSCVLSHREPWPTNGTAGADNSTEHSITGVGEGWTWAGEIAPSAIDRYYNLSKALLESGKKLRLEITAQ